jgi:hypothetical protein
LSALDGRNGKSATDGPLRSLSICGLSALSSDRQLVRMTVVIVPIAIGVPAVVIFVPPLVVRAPAMLASLVQIVARVFRLFALPAVVLYGFVQPVIGSRQPMLAFALLRADLRRTREQQKSCERGAGQEQFPQTVLSPSMFRFHPVLLVFQ